MKGFVENGENETKKTKTVTRGLVTLAGRRSEEGLPRPRRSFPRFPECPHLRGQYHYAER